jgi:hypothetical protein
MNWNWWKENNLPNIDDHIIILIIDTFETAIVSCRFVSQNNNEYGFENYIDGKKSGERKFIHDFFIRGWLPFNHSNWNKLHATINSIHTTLSKENENDN